MYRTSSAIISFTMLSWAAATCAAQPIAGQIVVDTQYPAWFKYQGGGPFYLCGPGDPESFLYRGTRNADGTRNGDQVSLIQKLVGTGANSIYLMAIRSHGGDGDDTENPYIDSDLTKGLDNDILNQWETWFTTMDNNGIVIFFVLYDDSASPFGKELPTNGQLKTQEVTFINAMVSRFKHHKHLIWCVAEEYAEGLSSAHAIKVAERIKLQDDKVHPIAIHQNSGTSFDFNGSPAFNQFAVQWNVATAAALHSGAVSAWQNVGGAVNINVSEFQPLSTGVELRHKLWAIATGGGYSMVLFMDIASTPVADLQTCGHLVRFMEATRFNEAAPRDDLAAGETNYVLANPGRLYIAYTEVGNDLGVVMAPGNYVVRWYDPASGAWIDQGTRGVLVTGVQTYAKPGTLSNDAALYLAVTSPAPAADPLPANGAVGVPVTAFLSWTAGAGTVSHEVRFGQTSPGSLLGAQSGTTLEPGPLESRTTYYWRIDEVNASGTTLGPVWTFTTRGVPGDMDQDADVDQADFGLFQVCFSTVQGSTLAPECVVADLNHDTLVDQADCNLFLDCVSGTDIPGDPACVP